MKSVLIKLMGFFCLSLGSIAMMSSGVGGCGGSIARGGDGGGGAAGTIGTSSGTLTTPDGRPVSGAAVVVTASASGGAGLKLKNTAGHPIKSKNVITDDESETCEDVDTGDSEVLGQDCTGIDGGYSLDYSAEVSCGDEVEFFAKKGTFSIHLSLTVNCDTEDEEQDIDFDPFEFGDDCGLSALTADNKTTLVLNGGKFDVVAECDSGDDDSDFGIPSMAVCSGHWDTLQDVLAKLGYADIDEMTGRWDGDDSTADFDFFTSEEFDSTANLNSSTRPSCCDLLQGETITTANGEEKTIGDYDIVFLNCGNGCDDPNGDGAFISDYREDALLDSTAQTSIQAYVQDGGRLYVTDLSYDFIEQNFASIIDFAEDGSDPVVAETPQVAQTGSGGITVDASVDEELLDYLLYIEETFPLSNGESLVNEDSTVTIEGFLGSWAQMAELHEGSEATIWVEGTVEGGVSDPQPLTVTAEVGDGEILYTSYHTVDSSSLDDGLEADELRPQEEILGFLVFEL